MMGKGVASLCLYLLAGLHATAAPSGPSPTPHGVVVSIASGGQGKGGYMVELAVANSNSFRVSASFSGQTPQAKPSRMIAPTAAFAPFQVATTAPWITLATTFGAVAINQDTGAFKLSDNSSSVLASADQLASFSGTAPSGNDTCLSATPGYDVDGGTRVPDYPDGLTGQTQASCCAACNSDAKCDTFVFASSSSSSSGPGDASATKGKGDGDDANCWLLYSVSGVHSASNRVVGGNVQLPAQITMQFDASDGASYYGSGAGGGDAQTLAHTAAQAHVDNREFQTSHFYSSDGYAAHVVAQGEFSQDFNPNYPVRWSASSSSVTWTAQGDSVDLYLMPAKTQGQALSTYWDLTGRPAIPPRYAFGFLACRWGWANDSYIFNTLSQFRNGNFPLDAWISDFGWYTPTPDYNLPNQGSPTFVDFSYNNVTFPNPIPQLTTYHDKLNLRFGGIRKPRLGNSGLIDMANAKGWGLTGNVGGNGGPRNLNFSIPAASQWYGDQLEHFLGDGVDFWWNDEGETYYYNFYDWNKAQYDLLARASPSKRFLSISRSYSPGMQRMEAVVWTGDIPVSWQSLQTQPGYVLNWELSGVGYITCDTGGFSGGDPSALLLTRWYQMAVFMPMMRVHSSIDNTPHFPFLWGPEPAAAMRAALNLRYQLLPMHYTLAHLMHQPNGLPIFRPLIMDPEFGGDASAAKLTSQWLDGPSLLAAPCMNQDNSTTVYLPSVEHGWYRFNTTALHASASLPTSLALQDIPLDAIPLFVKAGGILTLATEGMQYSDQLPFGPLELHVYPGKDGAFPLIEDDGETRGYASSPASTVRTTSFTWDDANRVLSWEVQGSFWDKNSYQAVQVRAFFPSGMQLSAITQLGTKGSVSFQ